MRLLFTLALIISGAVHAQSFRHEDGSIECAPGWTAHGSGCSLSSQNFERGQSDEARNWCPRGWTRQGSRCSLSAEGLQASQGPQGQDPRAERPDPRSERPDPRSERPDPRSQQNDSREDDLEDERWDSENCVGASWTRRPRGPGASFDANNSCGRTPPPPPRR